MPPTAFKGIAGDRIKLLGINQDGARLCNFYGIKPTAVKTTERFVAAEKEAREAGRGLWAGQDKEPAKTTGKYVGSSESNIYYLPTCRWAEKIKPENRIWFDSEEEAQQAGYEPCKVCNP